MTATSDFVQHDAAGETRPVFEISRLTKRYPRGNFLAIEDVDLTLAKGEFIAVVGSSGCGKSTLLKIMAGLLPPSSGRVEDHPAYSA